MEQLPMDVFSFIFQYLKQIDLIEASAVCKKWYKVISITAFGFKLKETEELFHDRDWLLKTYIKHFDRFRDSVYWDCLNVLADDKLFVVEKEIMERMFYSILPFRIWSQFWFCCRSQLDPNMCQYCTKLQIRNQKIINYVNKKLVFDVRKLFPFNIVWTVIQSLLKKKMVLF